MKKLLLALFVSSSIYAQSAQELTIPVNKLAQDGNAQIGEVVVSESLYGLVFTASLSDLTPGLHGFHIHENASCEAQLKDGKMVPGLAAGGHWDPNGAEQHGYSWQDDAHLGDLPALYVDENGEANVSVLAPRLTSLDEIKGHALMIHEGGDNHSDEPKPLGGGGSRMACGVIE